MTLPLKIDLEFIEPASYTKPSVQKYVYLTDPIGNGDERVGKIKQCIYSGMFFMCWDYIPLTDPITKRAFDSLTECECHIRKNVRDWWFKYHTAEEDEPC